MTRIRQILGDLWVLIAELWRAYRDPSYVPFSVPAVQSGETRYAVNRYFSRCTTCGRVFCHYWGCVTAKDREEGRQVGCLCGGMEMRVCKLPTWQEAYFLLSRYLWRKVWKRETYWDPRVIERVKLS